MNKLYFGDNSWHLAESINDDSIDLVYLDPPFNSQAQYNVFFKTPEGEAAQAQAEAFRDTWTWTIETEAQFAAIVQSGGPIVPVIGALRHYLKEADLMAYLVMITTRLMHLHRALRETGTIYLHCDPTASHYLKLIMDGIFGPANFRNEISWKRSQPKGHATRKSLIAVMFYFGIRGARTGRSTLFMFLTILNTSKSSTGSPNRTGGATALAISPTRTRIVRT